jgi:hypothetical protein
MNYTLGSIILILLFILMWTNDPQAKSESKSKPAPVAPVKVEKKTPAEIWYATRDISFIAEHGMMNIPKGSEVERVGPNMARYYGKTVAVGPEDLSPVKPY